MCMPSETATRMPRRTALGANGSLGSSGRVLVYLQTLIVDLSNPINSLCRQYSNHPRAKPYGKRRMFTGGALMSVHDDAAAPIPCRPAGAVAFNETRGHMLSDGVLSGKRQPGSSRIDSILRAPKVR